MFTAYSRPSTLIKSSFNLNLSLCFCLTALVSLSFFVPVASVGVLDRWMLKTQDASHLDPGFGSWQRCISCGLCIDWNDLTCRDAVEMSTQDSCHVKTHSPREAWGWIKGIFFVFGGAPNTGTLWVSLILEGLWTEGTDPTDLPPSCSPSDCHCFFNGKKA